MQADKPLIAIFCNSFPPEGGGASGRIFNLSLLLRNAGYRVQVVCALPNYPTGKIFPAYRGKLVVNEVVDGIAVRRVWLSPSNAGSAMARGWSVASFVLSLRLLAFPFVRKMKPSLIIVSSPPLPMASAVVRHFTQRNFKVLLNVSDIWPLSAGALGAMRQSKLYSRLELMARRMYNSVNAITAQSEETLAHIRRELARPVPMMLYRNLPHLPEQAVQAPAAKRERPRIIYPGLLGHAQGLLSLCRAIDFASLGTELHIYGEGAELEELRLFAQAHPQNGIVLHPPVSATALQQILAEAAGVLIPLITPIEGALPSKLFTAAQAGIPVLYSGGGEGAALVKEYALGWTAAPSDYTTISGQIRELVALSPAEMAERRKHIREVAARFFNREEQDERMLAFVAACISGI